MFGSAARRDASASSDVDLLVVRMATVADNDPTWSEQVGSLARQVERSTGNRAHIVELSSSELRNAALQDEPLIESLRVEARTIVGKRYRGTEHRAAANYLEAVIGNRDLDQALRDLANYKDQAHYGLANVRTIRAKAAIQRAKKLIATAHDQAA